MRRLGLWWVPLLLMMAPLAGRMPVHRDLVDFFAPMRAATAGMLSSGIAPWLNLANGCGEAWFANPETGILYPPVWLHTVLPASWAMTAEVALHLAWFSLGVGLLAGRLGARGWGRSFAEAAAWSAGPVLATVGVLNNLETLAWLPWMVLATAVKGRRMVPLLAMATAMGWLGGEPQIWALGVLLTLFVSRKRGRALAGFALGVALVAVQLVPFLFWVLEGDRGQTAAAWMLRGALAPADWTGLLVPGLAQGGERMVYAESLFFGAPILLCALLGGKRHRWILAAVVALGVLATLPEVGAGGLFLGLTGGLVRYPSRFALVGLALLLPLVGRGAEDWLDGGGRRLAVVVAAFTLLTCAFGLHPWRWWVAGAPAALMLLAALFPARRWLRGAVLAAGLAGMLAAGVPFLDLRSTASLERLGPTWPEAGEGGRIYTPAPAADVVSWLASGIAPRRLWPVGYLNLEEGLTSVRTYAPVVNRELERHLEVTDEGPARRWWLDTLGARWVILPTSADLPAGMEEVRRRGGMRLLRNFGALPEASLGANPPQPDEPWCGVGAVSVIGRSPNRFSLATSAPSRGWAWIALAPVRGWSWRLDGRPVELDRGPGIVQHLEIPEGRHLLEGWYRPPGLPPAAAISLLSLVLVLVLVVRSRVS